MHVQDISDSHAELVLETFFYRIDSHWCLTYQHLQREMENFHRFCHRVQEHSTIGALPPLCYGNS